MVQKHMYKEKRKANVEDETKKETKACRMENRSTTNCSFVLFF
ncbi:hypothetical protein ES703_03150 [subsurface metagenome]